MHPMQQPTQDPNLVALQEMSKKVNDFLRAAHLTVPENAEEDEEEDYILYEHQILRTDTAELALNYVIPHESEEGPPTMEVSLLFEGKTNSYSGPRIQLSYNGGEKTFEMEVMYVNEEEYPIVERLALRIYHALHWPIDKHLTGLSEQQGFLALKHIITTVKRLKKKQGLRSRRTMRPTKKERATA